MSITEPQTFSEVIDKWESAVQLASDVNVKEVTARMWRQRGIPSEYWLDIERAAQNRNIEGITVALLARIDAARVDRPVVEQEAAA